MALIAAVPLLAQQQPGQPAGQPAGQNPPGGAGTPASIPVGDTATGLALDTVEDFEEAEDWRAKATSPLGDTRVLKIVQRGEIRATDDENARPPAEEAYSIYQNAASPNHILGVKTYFNDRGFDRVEVFPPQEFIVRGKARQFSIWVLGRNFRHTLSIKLRDYRGHLHTLDFGRLDFFGWRRLTVTVPGWLPQSTRYSLLDKNLHFVSLFVTSDHHEVGGTFYFYVDGLKTLVDRSEQSYPGSEILDNW
ncbi:MAG: flagellar filament outer layer protein FlaA [Leptospirales bacterium]|nr:flagellar filament outer layer protein FlaA [Leptospirales bacterium]